MKITGEHVFVSPRQKVWEALQDPQMLDLSQDFSMHTPATRERAEWLLKRRVRWIAVDAGSADHPNEHRDPARRRGGGRRGQARPLARRDLPKTDY